MDMELKRLVDEVLTHAQQHRETELRKLEALLADPPSLRKIVWRHVHDTRLGLQENTTSP